MCRSSSLHILYMYVVCSTGYSYPVAIRLFFFWSFFVYNKTKTKPNCLLESENNTENDYLLNNELHSAIVERTTAVAALAQCE